MKMKKYCCINFPLFARSLHWMSFKNEYRLPHIYHDNQYFKINYCPNCGKEIKGISIKKREFNKL